MKPYALYRVLLLATAVTLSVNAWSADIPKRKSGLWEISMLMEGAPAMRPIQQCIDQNSDNLMQQNNKIAQPNCSVMDIKSQEDRVSVHSICKFGETTATTDAIFNGSFESAYKGDITTSYNPPIHGRAGSKVSISAKWLSACKPGQKPGDVILPNQKGININDMMNDPKFKEMMKQQQK